MATPYIHTSQPLETEVESGLFDGWGPVIQPVEGHHSIFAAVLSLLQHPNGVVPRKWVLEMLERQIRFIVSLHHSSPLDARPNPHLRTFEMRYLSHPDERRLEVVLLNKVFAAERERSRQLALDLWQEVRSLFPYGYSLQPVSSPAKLKAYLWPDWLKEMKDPAQIVEIKRYEEFVPLESEERVWEQNYLVYPFTWRSHSMLQVCRTMLDLPTSHLVGVSIRPTRLYEVEERHLCNLYATAEKLSRVNWLKAKIQGQIGVELYAQYLRWLKRPFVMRVQIVGEQAVFPALAHCLGVELTRPAMGEGLDVERNYELVSPDPQELERAKGNLIYLEQSRWGGDLASPEYRRFRYLVDAKMANCAFRIPMPLDLAGGERWAS